MDRPSRKRKAESAWLRTSPDQFDRQFPNFREPVEQGSFSLDEGRRFRHDSSQLRNFVPPADLTRCALDLTHGYKDMIHRDESVKEFLDDLLRWIMCNKHKFLSTDPNQHTKTTNRTRDQQQHVFSSINTDFVCWRGLLTRLLCLPYENQDDLLVAVIRCRGTYFMCEFDTETKKRQILQSTPRQKEMCAWGFKFEQFVTAEKNCKVPDTEPPVNTNTAFCTVARSRLSANSIVFGAEVDCQDLDSQARNSYIELKTSRLIQSQRQHENFCKYKLIKWWAQSFLIGIPRIVCGFRDDDGVVRSLQDYPVSEIPSVVKSAVHKPWKPTVCFNFLDAFLQFVKSNISTDNERCVYLFKWQPGADVTCQDIGYDPEYSFLPDWFTGWEAWDKPQSFPDDPHA
jgi:RAT1-interacting protein